jgi:hypothetical protein
VYNESVSNALKAYKSRTARQKYAKNEEYAKFREQVWATNHEEAMPPLKDLIPQGVSLFLILHDQAHKPLLFI